MGTSLPAGGLARPAVTPSAQPAAGPRDLGPSMEEPGLRAVGVLTGPCAAAWAGLPTVSPGARGAAGLGWGPDGLWRVWRQQTCGSWDKAGSTSPWSFPSWPPAAPPGSSPGAPAAAPPPVRPRPTPHTPCGLEQPCYSITTCCGLERAKPSCRHRHRSGALSLRWAKPGALRLPGDPQFPSPICHKRPLVFPSGRLFLSVDVGTPCIPEHTGALYTRFPFLCLPGTQLCVLGTFLTPGRGGGRGQFCFPELSRGRCWQKGGPSSLPRTGVSGWLWVGFSGPSKRPRLGPVSFLEGPGRSARLVLTQPHSQPRVKPSLLSTCRSAVTCSVWPAAS